MWAFKQLSAFPQNPIFLKDQNIKSINIILMNVGIFNKNCTHTRTHTHAHICTHAHAHRGNEILDSITFFCFCPLFVVGCDIVQYDFFFNLCNHLAVKETATRGNQKVPENSCYFYIV